MELLPAYTSMLLSEHLFNSGARDFLRTTTPEGGRISLVEVAESKWYAEGFVMASDCHTPVSLSLMSGA